jgi:mannose-1-phosphate guanylyltransferase
MKILVTAGGQGTKLWPYSRQNKPKQFQPIIGDKSSYEETIELLLTEFQPEDIYISTKRKFIKYVSEQSPQIPLRNYIVEPDVAKDRGPGEGLAFLRLSVDHPGEPFFLIQADCIRQPEKEFMKMIHDAGQIVARDRRLITGGIKALEPNLGVDYLKLGERVQGKNNQELYPVGEFVYRGSTYRQTKQLIERYDVVAHAQHYCWYPELMLEAYQKYQPEWHEALMKIRDTFGEPGEDAAINEIYHQMEKGPTEEVTKHVFNAGEGQVILLPFQWTDIGTWGSVYEHLVDDEYGRKNHVEGAKLVAVDTEGTLVKSDHAGKLVAVAGVEGLVIIDTEDALLIVPKNKIEKIKDIQAALQEREETEYL